MSPEPRTLDPDAIEAALRACGVGLSPGLRESEITRAEERYQLVFAPEHRLMLSIAVPLDDSGRWPDWRSVSPEKIEDQLAWPFDSILFDVEHNRFWYPGWPARPDSLSDALTLARSELDDLPRLPPLRGHRYLPSEPAGAGNPVLSCYQTDVIYYGYDLLDWFEREFHRVAGQWDRMDVTRNVPFWTWLVEDQ